MSMSQVRQLAAIMFTDIVGYTALMGKDEHSALDLLEKNRRLQRPIIEEHNGVWVKELGDGVMARFALVSDAVNAAVGILQACRAANDFKLRIGIHQGEVIIQGEDVFGDAVNIASRIQGIAVPDSIFVSEVVHTNVSNKSEFRTEFVRAENLKNVKEPVKVYRILLANDQPRRRGRRIPGLTRNSILYTALAVLMVISAYFVFTTKSKSSSATTAAIPEKSIAVLPFENRSGDKEQEYFSDGLSEELLNMLAKIPGLKVIGRTSSFAFKGKNVDLRTIGEQLGVAHLLEGSVQKDQSRIRVRSRLIRAEDGSEIWSESYDRELKNIFDLQDEIAQTVVQQLRVTLTSLPSANVSGTGNIEVYNLVLQGNYYFDKLDKESVARAVQYYKQALAIDSTDARAWAHLANAVSRQSWQNYIDQNSGYEEARAAAQKAISLDSNYAQGYLELADISVYHDFDARSALPAYQRALSLEPGNAEIINGMGDVHQLLGKLKEAEDYYRQSISLNPLKPITHMNLGNVITFAGRYEEAIQHFRKVLDLQPQFQRAHMYIGRNYLLMGKSRQALKAMEKENMEIFRTFGLALAYHALGRKSEADEKLKEFTVKYQHDWAYLLAQLHAFRGEKEAAFGWLETAYSRRDSWLFWVRGDPLLKNIRPDPRYDAFLRKLGLVH